MSYKLYENHGAYSEFSWNKYTFFFYRNHFFVITLIINSKELCNKTSKLLPIKATYTDCSSFKIYGTDVTSNMAIF